MEMDRFSMKAVSVIDASFNLHNLLDDIAARRKPVLISGTDCNTVLLAAIDWIAINVTPNLFSVRRMPESIAEGMAESIDDCASELDC
jgi:PHD/YefM family antitoxin component YafN of YafNO toxin-antitoxin module